MPELPEVEVIRLGLSPTLTGRTVTEIFYSHKPLRLPVKLDLMRRLIIDHRIVEINRRAKYLLVHFSNRAVLIIHLGMTGNLGLVPKTNEKKRHDHLCWQLDNGLELRLNDTRRFGSVQVVSPEAAERIEDDFFHTCGVEPLDQRCNGELLMNLATRRKKPIKTFLMDSQIIVGIGNIYANEILFHAGVNPNRPVNSLTKKQWDTVATQIKATLEHAISCGGSTIRDYINGNGEPGYFQMNFTVYGKVDDPCEVCSTPIEKSKIGGRATFFCPTCQMPP